jgi:hypothetical protein
MPFLSHPTTQQTFSRKTSPKRRRNIYRYHFLKKWWEKGRKKTVKSDLLRNIMLVNMLYKSPRRERRAIETSECWAFFSKFLTFVILDFQWKKASHAGKLMKAEKTEVIVTHIHFSMRFFQPEIRTSILSRKEKKLQEIVEKFPPKESFTPQAH